MRYYFEPALDEIYKPRLTVMEERCYICFVADTRPADPVPCSRYGWSCAP
nr:hypothetical protein [uncultured Acetatifactor sp.]